MTFPRRPFLIPFRLLACVLCVSALLATDVLATPTAHTQVRAIPLGVNDSSYFYVLSERRNPGSYYDYSESLVLVRRDISHGRLEERIKLRETVFSQRESQSGAEGEWKREERPTSGLDLGKYLAQNGVQMVFPTKSPKEWKVEKQQLVRVEKGKAHVVIDAAVMTQSLVDLMPEFDYSNSTHELRISAAFQTQVLPGVKTAHGMLVVVEAGAADEETSFSQHVVFVPN